jgi:RNA polymerase sigma-70 factor (ECF subfamily)
MMDEVELRGLVEEARAGHQDALVSAVEGLRTHLDGLILGICCDRGLAEEVLQDVYVKVLTRIDRLRAAEAFVTWLDTIAVRSALDAIRWQRPDQLDSSLDHDAPAADIDVELTVAEALKALPPNQRVVVVLHYWRDMAVQDIADVVGCEVGTVKSRLSRGRDVLASTLTKEVLDA